MADVNTAHGERRESPFFDQEEDSVVIVERRQAFGTVAQIWQRQGANASIPRIGDFWPIAIQDPTTFAALKVRRIRIESSGAHSQVHDVIIEYSTITRSLLADVDVNLDIGATTEERRWDKNGKPLLPDRHTRITVEVPTVELSITLTNPKLGNIVEQVVDAVGKTNDDEWLFMDAGQWIFMGVSAAAKVADGEWRATYRFRGLPPFGLGVETLGVGSGTNDGREEAVARQRARFAYYILDEPDGSVNREFLEAEAREVLPDEPAGLVLNPFRKTIIRDEADFDALFPTDFLTQ